MAFIFSEVSMVVVGREVDWYGYSLHVSVVGFGAGPCIASFPPWVNAVAGQLGLVQTTRGAGGGNREQRVIGDEVKV